MRLGIGTWLAAGFVLALSACDDEILTDVDLPKDAAAAAADHAADAPKDGAAGDAPRADAGQDEPLETADGGADASDSAAPDGSDAGEAATTEGGDAADGASADVTTPD
jgi:hypothetical protein